MGGTVRRTPFFTATTADQLPADVSGPGADARIKQSEEERCGAEVTRVKHSRPT